MIIKAFDSLGSLGDWYESEVFQELSTEMLYVHDRKHNRWCRYRWTSGRREIMFVDEVSGDLPLVTQVYPPY